MSDTNDARMTGALIGMSMALAVALAVAWDWPTPAREPMNQEDRLKDKALSEFMAGHHEAIGDPDDAPAQDAGSITFSSGASIPWSALTLDGGTTFDFVTISSTWPWTQTRCPIAKVTEDGRCVKPLPDGGELAKPETYCIMVYLYWIRH